MSYYVHSFRFCFATGVVIEQSFLSREAGFRRLRYYERKEGTCVSFEYKSSQYVVDLPWEKKGV